MSNDLVSQPFSIQSQQMGNLEPISNKLDSSILNGSATNGSSHQMSMSNMQAGLVGPGYGGFVSQQMPMSNMQMGLVHPMSNNLGSQILSTSDQQSVNMDFLLPNALTGHLGSLSNNLSSQQLSALNKRKTPMESMFNNYVSQKSSMANKRVAQAEHRPWLQAPDKRSVQQIQFMPNSPGSPHLSAPNKKVVQKESVPRPLKQSVPKSQNSHVPSPKGQNESFESVRSKMRESLEAALALVSQQQDKTSNVEKDSRNETASSPGKTQETPKLSGSGPSASDAIEPVSEEPKETLSTKEGSSGINGQSVSQEDFSNLKTTDNMFTAKCAGQDFQYVNMLPGEDVPFSDNIFARDELLQGNGLSWVLEPDIDLGQQKEISIEVKQEKVSADADGREQQADKSPQILASRIEAELFKLFGGVNKKYKEKGRSLLFNLKDRNNPELRERVMSGEITPERLCSMTAEELASKELSEWRMKKEEAFDQMIFLPDSEVDVRRLVKKTHKGEFQVEVEEIDTASVDVSVGASSLARSSSVVNKTESPPHSKAVGTEDEPNPTAANKKSNLEVQGTACTITIPSTEGADLMQGLMVDDTELKDAEFLPPIVSLDEFMESLDSEPPFENLPASAEKSTAISEKDDSDIGSESKSPVKAPQELAATRPPKPGNSEVTNAKSDAEVKPSDSPLKSETKPPAVSSKRELVWDGLLQLNTSTMTSVIALFKSGEKTSAKEWASFLEIKGRVRLDAFEKFLQELPMSRSRAVMIVHFVGKDGSPKSERGNLKEVADSYVLDGRVGFAEPAPAVELYICPPYTKTFDMLSKILAKDQLEALKAIDNGLIGVVVWRKAQLTTTISPNSASHPKHSSKKHITSSSRRQQQQQQDKDANMNGNITQSSNPKMHHGSRLPAYSKPPPIVTTTNDDDDDVPPGFGPGNGRDDDDLPEFNFSGSGGGGGSGSTSTPTPRGTGMASFISHPQASSRPVDQMRELIQKYGQSQAPVSSDNRMAGVKVQSWNDDDDDIPEWQPQAPQQPPQTHLVPGYQRPQMVDYAGSTYPYQQQICQPAAPVAAVPLQPPPATMNSMQGQQVTYWVPPSGIQQPTYPYVGGGGGTVQPGTSWLQDAPKSRGF